MIGYFVLVLASIAFLLAVAVVRDRYQQRIQAQGLRRHVLRLDNRHGSE
jgi:CHASE3 domain sensor protein